MSRGLLALIVAWPVVFGLLVLIAFTWPWWAALLVGVWLIMGLAAAGVKLIYKDIG